jgi:3-oxoacyl-[acyl-carrier protein] reductase
MPTYDFSGQVALVTGGGGGIGSAVCRRLASEGAAIAVHFRSSDGPAEAVAKTIEEDGGRAAAFKADLSDADEVSTLYDEIETRFGTPTIVVNTAGAITFASVAESEDDAFDKMVAANLQTAFLSCREAARRMGEGGRIINFSSVSVADAREGQALYAATKAAVEPLTKVLAKELGEKKITVNAIAPGATDTEMVPDDVRDMVPDMTPLGRIGQPADIAAAVAMLCSEDGGWITGQIIGVDGGLGA